MTQDAPKQANFFFMLFMAYSLATQTTLVAPVMLILPGAPLIWVQGVWFAFTFLTFFLMFRYLSRRRLLSVIPRAPLGIKNALIIIPMTLLLIPVTEFISALSMYVFPNTISGTLNETRQAGLIANLVIFAVFPALMEEILMRGLLAHGYRGVNALLAALVNGLFFGLYHMNGNQFFYAAALGVVFFLIVHYTGSVYGSMLAHFVLNGVSVLLQFVLPESEAAAELTAESLTQAVAATGVLSLFAAPSVIILLWFMRRINGHGTGRFLSERFLERDAPADEAAPAGGKRVFTWEFYVGTAFGVAVIALVFMSSGMAGDAARQLEQLREAAAEFSRL
ncbi:MAG: CPBP family intramembrane metalloprotease [Clostridiales bacterium]|jgi:membrane protease YdiL (CAAX protease family)|nr:CPBP family intramembrane metalloprotease [Clostridiales bacterium]